MATTLRIFFLAIVLQSASVLTTADSNVSLDEIIARTKSDLAKIDQTRKVPNKDAFNITQGQACWNGSHGIRATDIDTNVDHPTFKGYIVQSIPVQMCAPMVGQPCGPSGVCAPGAYCVHNLTEPRSGKCYCVPGAAVSPQSGMCECQDGKPLTKDGVCPGGQMHESCDANKPCGLEPVSKLELRCINGTCRCNPEVSTHSYTMLLHGTYAIYGTHSDRPIRPADLDLHQMICVPHPGHPCVSRGLCAPRSVCNFTSLSSWAGTCNCAKSTELKNGHCECPRGYHFELGRYECQPRRDTGDDYLMGPDSDESEEESDEIMPHVPAAPTTPNPVPIRPAPDARLVTPATSTPSKRGPNSGSKGSGGQFKPTTDSWEQVYSKQRESSAMIYVMVGLITSFFVLGAAVVVVRHIVLRRRRTIGMELNDRTTTGEEPYFPLI